MRIREIRCGYIRLGELGVIKRSNVNLVRLGEAR